MVPRFFRRCCTQMSSYQSCRAYRWHNLSYSITAHQTAETGPRVRGGQETVGLANPMYSWFAMLRLCYRSLAGHCRSVAPVRMVPYVERIDEYRTTVQQTPKVASRPWHSSNGHTSQIMPHTEVGSSFPSSRTVE